MNVPGMLFSKHPIPAGLAWEPFEDNSTRSIDNANKIHVYGVFLPYQILVINLKCRVNNAGEGPIHASISMGLYEAKGHNVLYTSIHEINHIGIVNFPISEAPVLYAGWYWLAYVSDTHDLPRLLSRGPLETMSENRCSGYTDTVATDGALPVEIAVGPKNITEDNQVHPGIELHTWI